MLTYFKSILSKIRLRIRYLIVKRFRKSSFYAKLYISYWHKKIHKLNSNSKIYNNYFSAVPNLGAGIGHQMANWIAGYWFARQFGLHFAHIPFPNKSWEAFLGFGEGEISMEELLKKEDYKKVRLPLFDEFILEEVTLVKKIIESYSDEKVVFVAEQDQFYRNQYGVMEDIKRKFYNANGRGSDKLIYSKDCFNIAVHIRRGDIAIDEQTKTDNLLRWQNNEYFEKVLDNVLQKIKTANPIAIYLFSQGELKDFEIFEQFANVHFCLNMGAQDCFLHMIFADILITSKSSFSYKPALLNNGIKICPPDFWHAYPETNDWVTTNENGDFGDNINFN